MEKEFILVTRAKHQDREVLPLIEQNSVVFWLVYLCDDTAIYRVRMDVLDVGKLKKAMDDRACYESVELFEFASW